MRLFEFPGELYPMAGCIIADASENAMGGTSKCPYAMILPHGIALIVAVKQSLVGAAG